LARQVVAATDRLADYLVTIDDTVNLVPVFQRLALEIIGGAIFSLDMRQYGPELRELILCYAARLGRPSLADFLLPLGVPTPADLARARFRRRWRRLIDRIIADRAQRAGEAGRGDLFDILAASDPETAPAVGAERLGDQIATIVVAGHETTAAALFWTLYLLARHPGEQERLAAEIAPLGPPSCFPSSSVPARSLMNRCGSIRRPSSSCAKRSTMTRRPAFRFRGDRSF
jgi:unspecific monooxygenase